MNQPRVEFSTSYSTGSTGSRLIDKNVKIIWNDPDCDWKYFKILGFEQGLICLKGLDDPKLGAHGSIFWCQISSINSIEVIE